MRADLLLSVASGLIYVDDTTDLAALEAELTNAGWRVARCAVEATADKASLIEAIAAALSFPSWTGRNLDALYDSLSDLSWTDALAVAVILDRSAEARTAPIDGWQQICEVLADAAASWQLSEFTFVAILR